MKKKFLHEAHAFEEDVSYLLHYIKVPNSLDSSKNRARRTLESCFRALSERYLASLDRHYKTMSRDEWIERGRPSREKIRTDLIKFMAKIPKAVERGIWKG
jgi:hypothetical protein